MKTNQATTNHRKNQKLYKKQSGQREQYLFSPVMQILNTDLTKNCDIAIPGGLKRGKNWGICVINGIYQIGSQYNL